MSSLPTPKQNTLRLLACSVAIAKLGVLGYLLVMVVAAGYGFSRDRLEAWKLERDTRVINQNAGAQLEIVDDVIAGQRSLAEAAAEFERLHARLPAEHRARLREHYPEKNHPDLFQRRVINLVAGRLEDCPEEQAAVIHRLEREYRDSH